RAKLAPASRAFEKVRQGASPANFVALANDQAGVTYDVGDLAAVAADDGDPTGEGFNEHAAELFAPGRRRLAGGAQHVHGVEVTRPPGAPPPRPPAHPAAVPCGPGPRGPFHRPAPDEQRPPRRPLAVQGPSQEFQPFLRHEPAEVADHRRPLLL